MTLSMPNGDNREVGLPTIGDYTFHIGDAPTNTSADDTVTDKYFDHPGARTSFCLRTDQTVQIISINGLTFTDPYTCVVNGSITERELKINEFITKMVIRTTVVNTNIKLRVRGALG